MDVLGNLLISQKHTQLWPKLFLSKDKQQVQNNKPKKPILLSRPNIIHQNRKQRNTNSKKTKLKLFTKPSYKKSQKTI